MPPPGVEAFARLFRALPPERRVAFVAELWAARGWDVEVGVNDITATRDGTEQRIRVVAPSRVLTPNIESADVVVSTRDSPALERAVDATGADYVPPAELRERLLYGVDRTEAAALFEEAVGHPLDSAEEHLTPPLTRRVRTGAASTYQRATGLARSRLSVVVVLLLLVAAAVVGVPPFAPAGETTQPAATQTATVAEPGTMRETTEPAAPAATERSYGLPPGVNYGGLADLPQLLSAHREGVKRRPLTLRVRASGPPNATLLNGRTRWNYTARVERRWEYRFDANYSYPDSAATDSMRVAVYANGGQNYRRVTNGSRVTYQRYPTEAAGYASKYADEVVRYLETFLRGNQSTAECFGEWTQTCRVTVTGTPSTLPEAVSGYRATATVETSGVVSSLRVNYALPDTDGDGERERVRFAFDYTALDETTVSEPAWLDAARNETSG